MITKSHYFTCASTDLFFLQETKQNMDKVVEIISKLKPENLKDLIKLNNDMIGNFNS